MQALVWADKDIYQTVKQADLAVETAIKTLNIFQEKHLLQKFTLKTTLTNISSDVFLECFQHNPRHRVSLVKNVSSLYISMRLKHYCRLQNDQKSTRTRQMNTKIILFKHE